MKPSLHGLRILNTRPLEQAKILSQTIIEAGGVSVECPVLEIKASRKPWINLLPDLNQVHLAVFISVNAVHYCYSELQNEGIHWPSTPQIIAIGQGTAQALKRLNIRVDAIPERPDSEHVLKLKSFQQLKNQTVLLFKGEEGRTLIEDFALRQGAHLIKLPVYQRVIPHYDSERMRFLWQNDSIDLILITSEQSLINLFAMFGEEGQEWLRSKTYLIISDRLAKAAFLRGIKKIIISHPHRMIDALFDYKG